MATRSRIGYELSDGSILSCYHHFDGYPSHLGRILKTHYNAKSLVTELIDGGDMSSCWTDERWDDSGVIGVYGPQYYSQRGEDCPPRLDANKYDYLADGEEYAYLFTQNNEWICYNLHQYEYNTMATVEEIPSGALAV
tara:strand:+ start:468 stop:881 length:414 start_codon:yes stop_codon:yes gene_type:complete